MSIKIRQPVSFCETGNRTNNEDSVFPPPGQATVHDRLFLVCDGVGGEHKGEIASSEACRCISDFLKEQNGRPFGPEVLSQALHYTSQTFATIEQQDPETRGMATTLTFLLVLETEIAIAHLGDSRIYQVRDGKIMFQTRDHNFVNELIEGGIITEEQAREHPKKNVITRVIQASRQDQPDFRILDDIRPGDYFFLCTDGVLERLYDELLEYHLGLKADNAAPPSELMQAIKEECEGMTNDNYSAYLIQIDSVAASAPAMATGESEKTIRLDQPVEDSGPLPRTNGVVYAIALCIGLLLFGSIAYFFIQKPQDDQEVPVRPVKAAGNGPANAMVPPASQTDTSNDKDTAIRTNPMSAQPAKSEPYPGVATLPRGSAVSRRTVPEKPAGHRDRDSIPETDFASTRPDTLGDGATQKIKTEKRILLRKERRQPQAPKQDDKND